MSYIFQYFMANISSRFSLLVLTYSLLLVCKLDGRWFCGGYSAGGLFCSVANGQKLWNWNAAPLARFMLGVARLAACWLGWGLNTEGTPCAKPNWFLLCRLLGSAFKKWGFFKAIRGGRGGSWAFYPDLRVVEVKP